MPDLQKVASKQFTNGVKFKNCDDYDLRVKEDARKLAELIYDIYNEQKVSNRGLIK